MQRETTLVCSRTQVSLIKNDEKAVVFQIKLGKDSGLGPDRSRALGVKGGFAPFDIAVEFGTTFDEEYSHEDLCEDFRLNSKYSEISEITPKDDALGPDAPMVLGLDFRSYSKNVTNGLGLSIISSKHDPAKLDISPETCDEKTNELFLGRFIWTISPEEWHDIVATMARLME